MLQIYTVATSLRKYFLYIFYKIKIFCKRLKKKKQKKFCVDCNDFVSNYLIMAYQVQKAYNFCSSTTWIQHWVPRWVTITIKMEKGLFIKSWTTRKLYFMSKTHQKLYIYNLHELSWWLKIKRRSMCVLNSFCSKSLNLRKHSTEAHCVQIYGRSFFSLSSFSEFNWLLQLKRCFGVSCSHFSQFSYTKLLFLLNNLKLNSIQCKSLLHALTQSACLHFLSICGENGISFKTACRKGYNMVWQQSFCLSFPRANIETVCTCAHEMYTLKFYLPWKIVGEAIKTNMILFVTFLTVEPLTHAHTYSLNLSKQNRKQK